MKYRIVIAALVAMLCLTPAVQAEVGPNANLPAAEMTMIPAVFPGFSEAVLLPKFDRLCTREMAGACEPNPAWVAERKKRFLTVLSIFGGFMLMILATTRYFRRRGY